LENKEDKMNKALFTALCLLPTAVIAHPGSGMVHDSQHVLWLFAVVVVVAVAAIGFSCKKKYH
jgi:K+-transporting ATPase A subunit